MNVFVRTQALRDRRWLGYGISFVSVLLSLGVRYALGEAAYKFPFVLFLPAVVVTTFVGGLRPGVVAAVLGGLAADLTLIAPSGSIWPAWPDGWLALFFYTLTVSIDVALIHGMTRAFRRAGCAESALRLANERLETRVRDRTAALEGQIAEREAAEAKLRQMQKMESVGQLTGGIAHDFNNMLAVVIGSLEMARRRLNEPDRLAGFLTSAEEGAKRAAQLVSRLLAFSRQQPLEPRALDANQFVAGLSELLRRTIGERVVVETVLAPDLRRCFVDAIELENAILNLAVNARDAMPDGGRLTIATSNAVLDALYVRTHPEAVVGYYVQVTVEDSGTGMPPAVIEKAFDPFYTTKGIGRGTGLGLSQVYGFVKQSGGHVAIYSEVGHGTTIRLYLPRCDDGVDVERPDGDDGETFRARDEEIVLVVEDEPGVREVSVDALRELGYTVMQAPDARAALGLVSAMPRLDLLLTDVVMPDMTGPQLAAEARALRPDLRVVFTTGYARNVVLQGDETDGAAAVLPKPFTLRQLGAKVREALDRAVLPV